MWLCIRRQNCHGCSYLFEISLSSCPNKRQRKYRIGEFMQFWKFRRQSSDLNYIWKSPKLHEKLTKHLRFLRQKCLECAMSVFYWKNVPFGVMNQVCGDMMFGQDFQSQNSKVMIEYGGERPVLTIPPQQENSTCNLTAGKIPKFSSKQLPNASKSVLARHTRSFSVSKSTNCCPKWSSNPVHHLGELK